MSSFRPRLGWLEILLGFVFIVYSPKLLSFFSPSPTMATASKVQLSKERLGVFHVRNILDESLVKASELLQENHESHHIFFNDDGFHKQFDVNKSYQRPPIDLDEAIVHDMHDPAKYKEYLGQEDYFRDYLVFFQEEIDQKGWQAVLNEYVFQGDERADDMLSRMVDGLLHPIIHLGFAVEFEQPAIVAEALAQAAVHSSKHTPFLVSAENAAKSNNSPGRPFASLLEDVRSDEKVATAAQFTDGNKLIGGVWARAPDEITKYASQFTVEAAQLEEKTAEMINAVSYFAAAAQNPAKKIKYDFFFIHSLNSSIFLSVFLNQPWLSTSNKVRLLDWKGRMDLIVYASRRAPKLLLDEVVNYRPKQQQGAAHGDEEEWQGIIDRVTALEDDGHASKLVRALLHGQVTSKPYEERNEFVIKDGMWLRMGHMAIDSVEGDETRWVRSAGFDEAWEKIGERPRAQL